MRNRMGWGEVDWVETSSWVQASLTVSTSRKETHAYISINEQDVDSCFRVHKRKCWQTLESFCSFKESKDLYESVWPLSQW